MLIYNGERYLNYSLPSILNQNMSEYEFITVDDNSKDNTLQILQKLKDQDQRIKIIKNKKNRGTLYSRTMAIIYAKGEYIMNLDCDDIYVRQDLFSIICNNTKESNYDIVEYLGIAGNSFNFSKKNLLLVNKWDKEDVIFQPDVSNYPFKNKHEYRIIYNANWLRAIKNDIYKKAVTILGNNMELRVLTTDDFTYTIIIHQIASTIKKIYIFGVYYILGTTSSLQKNRFLKMNLLMMEFLTFYFLYR